jgi:hypothetical protein
MEWRGQGKTKSATANTPLNTRRVWQLLNGKGYRTEDGGAA